MWISGSQVFGLISNFLILKILTSFLDVVDYGYYALLMSALLFFRQIAYDPISIIASKEAVIKNHLDSNDHCIMQIINNLTDRMFIYLFVFVAILANAGVLVFENLHIGLYLTLGAIYIGSNGAQGVYLNIINSIGERKWAAIGIIADAFVKLILIFTISYFYGDNLGVVLLAVAISSLLVFLYVRNITNRFKINFSMDSEKIKIAKKYLIVLSLPVYVPVLLTALKGLGDKLFMALFIGVEELAAYNVLLQIGFLPMMLFVGIIQTYSSPKIYKLTETINFKQTDAIFYIGKIVCKILILTLIAIIFSDVLSEFIFSILVGSEYLKYSKFLPYFVLAGALSGISGLLNVGVIGAFKSRTVGILMFVSILLGLIIFMIFVAVYGFKGGITGLIFSNLIMIVTFGGALVLCKIKN
jgi:O-antigen/teichoic acid export membrane protein